ncbi:MAG: general stress protein [Alphaproteobacteria bacterium]|nr:general stress protein [Alphaproteobacteria bacterium]
MPTERELLDKFWRHLKSDRTIMLGLDGDDAHPMTALFEDEDKSRSRVWIFTSKQTSLAQRLAAGAPAVAQFAAKGHDLFAAVHGRLTPDNDAETIDRLWSPFVAAWYEGGKADPDLQLLRFDLDHAQIWENENSVFAGIKMLLGADPKRDYADKVADVNL